MKPTNKREARLSHSFADLHRAGRTQQTQGAWWSETQPWKPVQNKPRAGRFLKRTASKCRRQGAREEIAQILRD